jgi:hypothetical protein
MSNLFLQNSNLTIRATKTFLNISRGGELPLRLTAPSIQLHTCAIETNIPRLSKLVAGVPA